MLGVGRAFGELFRWFRQPAIVGEILAGILLGPTVLGSLAPDLISILFPAAGAPAVALRTINVVAVVLLLLIAGLEVDLSTIWKQGRAALAVSVLGVIIPFGLGMGLAYLAPSFWGSVAGADTLVFALFFGTALSISALPVAARILMDLGVFKTDIGMLIMAAAMFNDLIGWIIFSIVLSMMGTQAASPSADAHVGMGMWATVGLTLGLAAFILTIFRSLVHRVLPWIQSRLSWPGGVLSFVLVLALLGAAATEMIGVHAIFGAFLVGIAIGDSRHMREQTRSILHEFVTNILAPIFFVSIGLQVNFLKGFDPLLVVAFIAVSFIGKTGGSLLGARWGGLARRESWAVSCGMNAHGAMEIILGLLALQFGVIREEMFIALVSLSIVGALFSGPALSRFIVRPRRWTLDDLIVGDLYRPDLGATTIEGAIRDLSRIAARSVGLDPNHVADAVLAREELMGTAIGEEIAVPHARLEGLSRPVLVIGHSEEGIDFNSPDGRPVRLIFLLLTPKEEDAAQIQIIGQIARCFGNVDARQLVYERESVDVLRAFVKIESPRFAMGHR